MTSAKLRAWGSYLSKKVDDTFYSIIPKPPQSEPQVSDPQVSDPQVSDPQVSEPQEAEPQEADPPYLQELLHIREFREAVRGGDETLAAYQYRQKQRNAELIRKNTCRLLGLYMGVAAIVFIILRWSTF